MRTFTDYQGREWEAAASFGSYGALQLIFARRNSSELRSCSLQAATLHAAEQELADSSEPVLRERLESAERWP